LYEKLEITFSEQVPGIIWKTLADPDHGRLYIEVRNNDRKQVSFSALDLENCQWLWYNVTLDEPWWISLAAVSGNTLLFTVYTDTNNPDKKSIFAFDILLQKIQWWKVNFSITEVVGSFIRGVDSKFGSKEVMLKISDGMPADEEPVVLADEQNFIVIKPFQYPEGSAHFETLRSFVAMKCNILPVISIEYCEYHSLILISVFEGPEDLANYLIVFNSAGDLLLKETLGEHLKGIALDTFFIFSGFLIFVKNKRELVSYRFV
jgi:hypothetical protein